MKLKCISCHQDTEKERVRDTGKTKCRICQRKRANEYYYLHKKGKVV